MANAIPIKVNNTYGIVEQFATTDVLLADGLDRRSASGNIAIGASLDTIEATGSVTVTGVTSAGQTITINGVVLTAVAGARTPGSDDFSISSGTTTGIAADIVAAINDGANSFTTIVTAVQNSSVVELTAVPVGSAGNSITLATSDAGNFTLSGATLSGGAEEELVLGGTANSIVHVLGDLTVDGSSTISVNETVTGNFTVEGDTSLGTNDGDIINLGGGTSDVVNLEANLVLGAGIVGIGSSTTDYLSALWLDAVNTNGPALAAYNLVASGTNAGAYSIGIDPSLLTNATATDLMTALDELDAAITASGADTLQTAYVAGNTISVTAGEGTIDFSNDTTADTTTVLTVSRTPAASTGGNGIDLSMGANTTGIGLNITGSGSGDLLFVNNSGTGDAIDIQDGGTSVLQVTGAGATNITPTSGQSLTMTVAGAGVIDINAAGAITLDSTGAGISLDAAGASNFSTSTGTLTLETAAGDVDVNATTGVTIDATAGGISIDGAGNSNFSTSSGTMTLAGATTTTVQANGGTITLDAVAASGDGTVVITNTGATPTGADLEFAVAGSAIVRSGDALAEILVSNLVSKAAAETITGGWTFSTSNVTFSGIATAYTETTDPTAAANTGFLYVKDDAGDTELYYRDDSGNIVQITQDGALAENLQQAYVAGNTIAVTSGEGTIGFSNDTTADTTTVLTVSRTPAASTGGNGIDLSMGANTTGIAFNLTAAGSGDALFVNNTGTGDAIDIQDGGGSVLQVTGAGATNITPTSGQSLTMTVAGAGVVDVNAAGAITLDSTGAGISLDAAGASNFSTSTGTLTLETASGDVDINATTGVTIDATGGGISIDGAGASNFTTSTGDMTVSTASGTLIMSATTAVTIDATAGGISIDGAGASNFSTSSGNITIDAAAGELTFDDVGNSGIELSQSGDRVLDHTGTGQVLDGVTSIIGALNALAGRGFCTVILPIENGVTVSAGYVVAASTTSGRVTNGTGGSGGNSSIIGIALSGGTGDAGGTVLCEFVLPGSYLTVTGGSFTPGTPVFAPLVAGPPSDTFGGGSGDRNIRLGYAVTATDIVFQPTMGIGI